MNVYYDVLGEQKPREEARLSLILQRPLFSAGDTREIPGPIYTALVTTNIYRCRTPARRTPATLMYVGPRLSRPYLLAATNPATNQTPLPSRLIGSAPASQYQGPQWK